MNKSKQITTDSKWPKIRKFFNDLHLWFGLISGIVVLIVCLTGTIYVYNTEIREAAAPHLFKVEKTSLEAMTADDLLVAAKNKLKVKFPGSGLAMIRREPMPSCIANLKRGRKT